MDVYKPDLIVAVNFRKGLEDIEKVSDAPVVCWEIDPAVDTPPKAPKRNDDLYIFTYRRPHIEDYQASGYRNVRFLPLASNPATRHPLREAQKLIRPIEPT